MYNIKMYDWEAYAKERCGYEIKTTFGNDFDIADYYGDAAIEDTFKRAFKFWREDYIYLTELVLILNWKIWQWYGTNDTRAKLYNNLWQKADEYACTHLTGDELSYFYRTTD